MATEGGTHSFRLAWMDALLSTPNEEGAGDIDAFARAVAFVLYRHMDRQGLARPSARTLARQSGSSPTIVMDRLKRLEAAGWLDVNRNGGKANRYSARIPAEFAIAPTVPRDETPERSTVPRDDTPDHATGWNTHRSTAPRDGTDDCSTVPPDGTEPRNTSTEEGSPTTHERPDWQRPPRQKWEPYVVPEHRSGTAVVADVLWPTMAFRRLELEREQSKPGLPHRKSFGEVKLLRSIEARMVAEHEKRAKEIRDKGRVPFGDLERFIFELDPTLSRHGWGPSMAAAQAENERRWREQEERLAAMTPEAEQAAKAEARATRDRIVADKAAQGPKRQRRTNLDGPPSPAQVQEAS